MNIKKEDLLSSEVLPKSQAERSSPTNGSHGVALNQSNVRLSKRENILLLPTEVHLTVRISNKSLTRRHLRLILETLLYEIFDTGISLEKYLMLVFLYQNLLGQKTEPLDLQTDHERRLCLLTEIVMLDLSAKSFEIGLPMQILSEDLRKEILENEILMSKRTYNSRKYHWLSENWLLVRPVGIDSLIERSGNSIRYSSYCKGYGESHPSAHFKKTKPSVELDGKDPSEPQVFRLKELQKLLILSRLRLKPKAKVLEH